MPWFCNPIDEHFWILNLCFVFNFHFSPCSFAHSPTHLLNYHYFVHGRLYSEFNPPLATGTRFQYVGWTPVGHGLVYIQKNNIYYWQDPSHGTDEKPRQITFDGQPKRIYNGVPDWVYEEEILMSDHALWWSPDGRFLLYAVFNDSHVRQYYYPYYGALRSQYGEERSIPYPKPGAKNPTIRLKVYDVRENKTVEVKPPEELKNSEYYITTIGWRDRDFFLVTYMNRPQNMSVIQACKAANGQCKTYRPPIFSKDGTRYFWILPRREGNSGMYKQVAMVEFPVSKNQQLTNREGLKVFLTSGTMDVTEIVGYDSEMEIIYYIAAPDPKERHLYSVKIGSHETSYNTKKCLTCQYDKSCQYVSASFSASGRYYMLGCQGPGVPYYILKSPFNDDEVMFESNEQIKKQLSNKKMPEVEYFKIKVSDNEYLHGKLLLPPQLNKEEIITYPLLLTVYGGPNSQMVTKKFTPVNFETYLCSSNGVIIGYVDARGTGARGLLFLHSIYKRLGKIEVADTIAAGNFYDKLSYVDSSKKAIWGWSYGGFLTTSVLGSRDPPNPFNCGIAVAPVTDWNYYDSVYAERYMNTIDDNPEGYKMSNVSRHAANFKKSNFMLIHGTGDDNVHFQNSAQLMKALVEANVFFRSQIYTDQKHSLNTGNTKRHLYETMDDFLNVCFHGTSRKFEIRTKHLQLSKQETIDAE
ncbi:hypothetical protein FSP39_010233 [Pinctada imbricata]|uniref:Dipeptidyl peptidase 4 n=1 Tax=Pinctada imbricata TaxID=66713 RepID=A0AA89BJA3_PINIB|nr:hypothetical protein FSP39_010233 [Pinctada imbricata]